MSFFNKIFGTEQEEINPMKWINLTSIDALEKAFERSKERPVAIFKHSTRCFISRSVLSRFERQMEEENIEDVDFYFLDLLAYRDISSKIAADLNVNHQSPQLIILKDGRAIYDASHDKIDINSVKNSR